MRRIRWLALEEEGAIDAGSLEGVRLINRCTVGGGVDSLVLGIPNLSRRHFVI